MKLGLFVISLVLIAQANGMGDMIQTRQDTPHVGAALEVTCNQTERDQREACIRRYAKAFESGEIEPLAVLRMHCTRFENPWESGPGEPPSMCAERFGGWVLPEQS